MFNTKDTIDKTIENSIAVQKDLISNPGTIFEAKIMMKAFITNVNKPKVKIFIGREKIIRKGLTSIFNKAKTKDTIRATGKEDIFTPLRIYAVAYTAKPLTKNLIIF